MGRDRFDHLIGKESEFLGTYRVSVSLSKNLGGAIRQCRSKFGRGVPRTAIAPTTGSQKGSTPKPGIASRTSPGKSSHCRPSTMNSSSAVPISTAHTIGGKGVAKAPMASEMLAMAKARASRFLENLRVFEIGVPALVGCLLGSVGGGVIWVWSAVIGSSFVIGRRPERKTRFRASADMRTVIAARQRAHLMDWARCTMCRCFREKPDPLSLVTVPFLCHHTVGLGQPELHPRLIGRCELVQVHRPYCSFRLTFVANGGAPCTQTRGERLL